MTMFGLKNKVVSLQKNDIACSILTCIAFAVLVTGCFSPSEPSEPIDMSPLMIDVEELPEKWWEDYRSDRAMQPLWEDQVLVMFFYYEGDSEKLTRGSITIYRYSRDATLQKAYAELEQNLFGRDSDAYIVPPYTPAQVTLHPAADKWQFACYGYPNPIFGANEGCRYIAQYERYMVFVSVNMMYDGQRIIEIEEIGELIRNVDQHVSRELEAD